MECKQGRPLRIKFHQKYINLQKEKEEDEGGGRGGGGGGGEGECTRQSALCQTSLIQEEFGVMMLPTNLLPTSLPEEGLAWYSANSSLFVLLPVGLYALR